MSPEELKRITHEFRHGKPHGVEFNVTINCLLEEMDNWPRENVEAFMRGIATVLSTQSELTGRSYEVTVSERDVSYGPTK